MSQTARASTLMDRQSEAMAMLISSMMGDTASATSLFDNLSDRFGLEGESRQRLRGAMVADVSERRQQTTGSDTAKGIQEYNQEIKKIRKEALRKLIKELNRNDPYYAEVCVGGLYLC